MAATPEPYVLLEDVLSNDDLRILTRACQQALAEEDSIPSYVMLNDLTSPVYRKVHAVMEAQIGQPLFYLNDFYLYSDETFGAPWHMDTELFTFARCINAWVLLSPNEIESPLTFIADVNIGDEIDFHSVQVVGDNCTFTNYRTRKRSTRSLADIEARRVDAPPVRSGDILLLDPKRFHRTLTTVPKHAIVFKFLLRGTNGFMSEHQVPPMFWSEVSIFEELVRNNSEWSAVIDGLRAQLRTEDGRRALSAGFFPEKIDLYRRKVAAL